MLCHVVYATVGIGLLLILTRPLPVLQAMVTNQQATRLPISSTRKSPSALGTVMPKASFYFLQIVLNQKWRTAFTQLDQRLTIIRFATFGTCQMRYIHGFYPPNTKFLLLYYMKQKYDAIIIGAGIIGCCIAFELCKKGYKTINVDFQSTAGAGSTANSCGNVRFHYSTLDGVMPHSFKITELAGQTRNNTNYPILALPSTPGFFTETEKWNHTGKPVVLLKYPSSPSASVFALRATPRQDTAVIRLALGVTSRRSNYPLLLHSSTGKPVVFCEGG